MDKLFFQKFMRIFRRFLACAGPGYLVAVGYMDLGNWVTDLAGGARYGYLLVSVIFISNIMAMVLQFCALKLGIAAGKDLARACRDYYSYPVAMALWVLAELAIIATDLAEVIGSAIALKLLFNIPIIWGICITVCDVFFLLILAHRHAKMVEILVTALIGIIIACFGVIIYLAQPSWSGILSGLIPSIDIIKNPDMLYLAIGILGATVMPHNLYLHSALVMKPKDTPLQQKQESILYSGIDVCVALTFAFFVNAAILIVSAALFFERGLHQIADIQDAYYLFTPLLQAPYASVLFAVALLISGQNSTFTGTLAGQIIMEGFTNFSLPAWQRRLISRAITIVPALIGVVLFGECCLSHMMIVSQIILSLQLPFAIFPLIQFTNSTAIMGPLKNSRLLTMMAFVIGTIIAGVNLLLLYFLFV